MCVNLKENNKKNSIFLGISLKAIVVKHTAPPSGEISLMKLSYLNSPQIALIYVGYIQIGTKCRHLRMLFVTRIK